MRRRIAHDATTGMLSAHAGTGHAAGLRIGRAHSDANGRLSNGAFLIGVDGRIVTRQDWNDARGLERAINNYLGR